ncbi:hypothetical protein JZ751_007025, partial [Albula glossodonta]
MNNEIIMNIEAVHLLCLVTLLFSGESCGLTVYGKTGEDVYLHLQNTEGLLSNGTLKLSNVQKNCSGVYTAIMYNNDGIFIRNESNHLIVVDPPVVELVICTLGIAVFRCAGENGADAVYRWRVSIHDQGEERAFSITGKYMYVNETSGNIICSLEKDSHHSDSDPYSFSCA